MRHRPATTALARWFARSGFKQCDVAAQLGISEPTMSRLISGIRQPSLPLAIKISRYTGIPPADLVNDDQDDQVA